MLKISESDTDTATKVTIGDDADAADDVDYTYLIPNEESGRVMPDIGPEVQILVASYFGFHADY